MSSEAVRKRRQRLGLSHTNPHVFGEKTITKFVEFLRTAKTEKQIRQTFGNNTERLLTHKFEGLVLFNQRNRYNELVYILLPSPNKAIKVKPRDWQFHRGVSDEGIEQPYLLVQIPNFKKTVTIAPLFDIHYGNFAHRREKFLAYIRWIAETPNVYAILGGDIMENALDDGRGMTYDQNKNPQTQFEDMVEMLAPIAHKILVSVPGNHEERTYKKTGFDVSKEFAARLDIPYFTGPVIMSIMGNGYKWTFYVQHGRGNSQTKGGKMNMASRPKGFTSDIQFFVSGHVHDLIVEPEACLIEDPINCRLVYMTQWTVVCPAFLSWEETYAYRAGYKPPARGGVSIEIEPNGEYRAKLT